MTDLVLAILCSSALALFLKAASFESGNRYGILLGNYISCFTLAFLTAENKSAMFSLSGITVLLAILGGVFFLLGLIAIQKSIPENGAALTSAFSKLGMIVSLFLSVVFFREKITLYSLLGIGISLLAILVVNHDPNHRGDVPVLLLFTLAVNGIADSFARLFREFCPSAEENGFLFLLFLTAGILTFLLSRKEKRDTGKSVSARAFLLGILAGVPNYYSSLFLIRALITLPAVFVYPVFSVGSILTIMTLSALLFHERLSSFQKGGLFLVILALVFLNL